MATQSKNITKKRGKFITLEGIDGAGKSTHIPNIIAALNLRGVEVVSTREQAAQGWESSCVRYYCLKLCILKPKRC